MCIRDRDGINDKLKEMIYQTQKSVDEDELTFKQSIAKSKECYVPVSYTHLEYRQFQDGGSYRGIRGTAKIRNQYCIWNVTYQVWFCGDSV